jgi:hypothetical protein
VGLNFPSFCGALLAKAALITVATAVLSFSLVRTLAFVVAKMEYMRMILLPCHPYLTNTTSF